MKKLHFIIKIDRNITEYKRLRNIFLNLNLHFQTMYVFLLFIISDLS